MAIRKTAESAKNNKPAAKKTNETEKGRGKGFFLPLIIILLIVFCALIIYLVCMIPNKLMYKNPRFKLQKVEVTSPGFWHGKGDMLLSKLGNDVKIGTNIFLLNVGDIRKKLLDKVSNIEDAEVQIVLPDMLVFDIRERIPRAEFGGNIVVDEYGKLFKRSESSAANRTLPRLIKKNPDPKLQREAIRLIMTATRECQNIVIESVKIENPRYFEVRLLTMNYNNRSWKVIFPIESESYSILFNKLQSAILHTYLKRDNPIGFDLRFKNYATPIYK